MIFSLKIVVPAIGAVAGASVVISVVSKSSSGSKYSPTELKVKNVGNCKLVAGKEEGKEREKSQLIVCLSGTKEQPTKPEVTFKWFKNLEDSEPVNVKQITITPQGRLQFLLNQEIPQEMIHWNPSSEVLDGTGDVKIEKPDKEQLIESSKCQVSSGWQEDWNWKIVCLTK